MSDELELKWKIDETIFNGYPHVYYKELPVYGEKWQFSDDAFSGYPFIYDRVFLNFAAKSGKWRIDESIFDGYPHCYFKGLIPPYHLPQFVSMSLSRTEGFAGISGGLTVSFSRLKYIVLGDVLVVEVVGSSNESLFYNEEALTQEGVIDSVSYTIPVAFMQSIPAGEYTIKAAVKRSADEIGTTAAGAYKINALPDLTIKSISPATLQKPVNAGNKALTLTYGITGAGVEQITNKFTLAGFETSKTINRNEKLAIESETRTGSIYDVTMSFTVTDSNFKLVSFKFKFGLYNTSTEVDYRLDGVTVQKGTYPMGGWVEYVAPTPIALSPGTHSIRLYNSPSYWYLYSTSTKPTVPGMTITSTTVYAMEMAYTISSSGVEGEHTAVITADDTINPGVYPLLAESSTLLTGYGAYDFSRTAEGMLEVLEAPVLEPDIGGVSLSKSGRYTDCETDITVNVSGLAHILAGDAIKICLKNGAAVLYEKSDTLVVDAVSHSHTIPAVKFEGLGVGAYSVTAEVSRGSFAKEGQAEYRVIAKPAIDFVSVTPDTVQLPILSALTITSTWKATGDGINSIQGTVSIADTSYSTSINTASQNFNAVFTNITALTGGFRSLAVNITVTSNEYGSVTINSTVSGKLEILMVIPDPEVGGITLSISGRYVGSETNVTANISGLGNILNNDSLNLRLCQGSAVFYEHSETLTDGLSEYALVIPKSSVTGLDAGTYSVKAVIKRNAVTSNEVETAYKAVPKPAVQFISITPEKIQLPIVSAMSIVIALAVNGEGVNEISGSAGLGETSHSAGITASGLSISATLTNVTDLDAKGYFVAVNLTVKSDLYGTAVLSADFVNVLRVLEAIVPKDLGSGALYIYKGFELVAVLRNYVSFKWIRRYNKIGEFLLQLENTAWNVDLIHSGNIIAKDNDDEAGFIEDITITDKIEVKGMFITKMLSYRICSFSGETPVDMQSTANRLIRDNFIDTSASRVIADFRIADFSISPQSVTAKIENSTVLQWLENQDVGFKVRFNTAESKFDFVMYDGKQSDAVFCESYRNITDQQYYEQTANAKNVCYVEGEEQVHEIGSAQGLNRREAYAKAGKYNPFEYGNVFLKQNKPVESLDVKIINPYSPFEYKADYDVGDIVKVTSEEYRVEITKNILEITEFFDHTGFHLYIVFGDIPRDLLTELQDKESRLEVLENAPEPPNSLSEEAIENLKELIIPEIVDEVFEQLEFPPLPDYLSEDNLREAIGIIVDEKLKGLNLPGGGTSGDGSHVIIDHLPATQAEIDTFPLNAEVLVYNPDNPYIPSG